MISRLPLVARAASACALLTGTVLPPLLASAPAAAQPVVTPGDAAPKPGYTSCKNWCRVRIVSSEVRTIPTSVPGKFAPVAIYTIAVHNASGATQRLTTDYAGQRVKADGIRLAASIGSEWAWPGSAWTHGPILNGNGQPWSPRYIDDPITLPSGAEVQLTYFLYSDRPSRSIDGLMLVHMPRSPNSNIVEVTAMPEPARWLCPYFAREQELKASGDLAAQVAGLPALCASGSGGVPAPSAEPAPAPGPIAQPTPRPAPMPSLPAPGTVQAGVFHPLEGFDVRVDELRAGRDGRLHVFVTAKNRSGREFYMSTAPFTVYAIDADGVGVEAEGKPFRATGEEAAGFDQVPTIAAGGEFRFRYLLDLPKVHGPLARVAVREGKRKSLLFDANGADPAPGSEGAPAVGRGAFKRLSKFDVRIDNVVPARDGRMEVFLTLRNVTSEVQSTSKGAIQLSSSNADGGKVTSVSALYSVRGERGRYDELPLLVYAQPGAEMRLRYLFDEAISGPITVSDGTVAQTFTAGA